MSEAISIRGASTHNLKSVSLEIPKHRLVAFSGVSGSGKSSLVFDTIYTEAQRQLIETFSSFARRRLPKLSRPPVEEIRNLATAIIIDQKRMGSNLRSTVGTAAEISTYLRLLFSRCGEPFIGPSFFFSYNHPEGMCPDCRGLGRRITVDTELLLDRSKSLRNGAVRHPDYKVDGWGWRELVAMDLFDAETSLESWAPQEIERLLFAEGIPITKRHGAGVYAKTFEGIARKLERLYLRKGEIQLSQARKNAYERYFIDSECPACGGSRLNQRARSVRIRGRSIAELCDLELDHLDSFLKEVPGEMAEPLVRKMRGILGHLIHIGVGYLSLNRAVMTLSGGESQRVKMARQLDCDLVDLLYILDEPSIGLHPRDIGRLIDMLAGLRDRGNSVLVVEHDPTVIRAADWIIDLGPEAGNRGGEILYSGTPEGFAVHDTATAKALYRPDLTTVAVREQTFRRSSAGAYRIRNACLHNLRNLSVEIPKAVFTCVTGVAGSGKSSLIHKVFCRQQPEAILVDQSPVGRSSRSNPATYIGAFDEIRKSFAAATGTKASLFSFNSGGACPKCKGLGYLSMEMSFLDDVTFTCDECGGRRYTGEVLDLCWRDKNIFDVLCLTIEAALEFFENPKIIRRLEVLCEVGLGYLELGQPLSTLSGGEAQRIKLASELHREGNLYVMDEPTTGLHPADIRRLLGIIDRLVEKSNTVVVIEHNLEVISAADWIIDLGPEGGSRGGRVIAVGTPEQVAACQASHTGRYLQELLRQGVPG